MERQKAEIISIKDNLLSCTINCAEACQGCAARKVCSADGKGSQKDISLYSDNSNHKVGDIITLEVSTAMGLKAVLLAYILPVILILLLIIILKEMGVSELISGLSALGGLTLYFLSLKFFKWGKSVSISILEDTINE